MGAVATACPRASAKYDICSVIVSEKVYLEFHVVAYLAITTTTMASSSTTTRSTPTNMTSWTSVMTSSIEEATRTGDVMEIGRLVVNKDTNTGFLGRCSLPVI